MCRSASLNTCEVELKIIISILHFYLEICIIYKNGTGRWIILKKDK